MTNISAINDPWLNQLHHLIDKRLRQNNLSNEQLASDMNMSERQFYRKFRKRIKTTPNQYFTKYRMQKALLFMKSGEYLTVRELAFAVGYKKDSYFSSLFKKEFGHKPLEMMRYLGIR